MSVSTSYEPERANTLDQIASTINDRTGTCTFESFARPVKNKRSLAIAYGTRAVARIEACNALNDEVIIAAAISVTAVAPSKRLMTSAAVDELAGTLAI